MSMMDIEKFRIHALQRSSENKKFLKKLRSKNEKKLDENFHRSHETVFQHLDCLTCANCCKTTSPIFYKNDMERLARHFGLKPGKFIENFLKIDEDGDYVLKSSPCPFLQEDHHCSVYSVRPKACREYPHTQRKKMYQVLDLAYKNTLICPAVLEMVEMLKKETW